MILVLWEVPAVAGDAFELAGWSTTALEVLPNLAGDTGVRVRQQVGVSADLPANFELRADGALRRLAFVIPGADELQLDVHRLVVTTGERRGLMFTAGRTVLLDPRGFIPLDGLAVEAGDGVAHVNGFAGRLWNPEPMDVADSLVGGVGVTIRPPGEDGAPSRTTSVGLSAMVLASDGDLSASFTGGGAVRGPRGARGTTDVEVRVDPDATNARAGVQAVLPIGNTVRISPELRWEGLSPTGQVVAARTPIEWLAGSGYGVAGLGATWYHGDLFVEARGAAVVHDTATTSTPGAHGRFGVGWRPGEGPQLGLFSLAAGIGSSWVAGAGFEAGYRADRARFVAEGGLFEFQPLSGQATPVSEIRVRGGSGFGRNSGMDLSVEWSAGSDRLLQRWMQGGVVLSGWLGGGQDRP